MKHAIFCVLICLSLLLTGCTPASAPTDAPTSSPTLPETAAPEATAPEAAAPETPLPETVATEALPEHFTLTFVGDCTLGCSPANYYAGYGYVKTIGEDYGFPFANVIDYFQNDECSFANLEGPLADGGHPMEKRFAFRGPRAFVEILTGSSVDFVTLGNNHAMDYGPAGYASTLDTLNEAGIPFSERDCSRIFTTEHGLTIGVYAMVYYKLDVEDMVREIADMRDQGADFIIVAPHWGVELTYQPTQEQIQVGRAAIDAGADFVWGSHPHVLQPIETYGDGIICYSLGNFSFGGNIYPQDYDSAIIQLELIREGDGSVTMGALTQIPVTVSSIEDRNNFQPTPYEEGSESYSRVLSKLDGTYSGPNLSAG